MTTPDKPTTTPQADPRDLLFGAAEQVRRLTTQTRPDQWAAPTPCAEFDVLGLGQHLVGVLYRVAHVADGSDAFGVPSVRDDVPAERIVAELEAGLAAARDAWSDDAVLTRTLNLPFGQMPGAGAAVMYVNELSTHAWDLAMAIGAREELDDRFAEIAEPIARQYIPDGPREQIPFGPAQEVAAQAPAYERLAAWTGRDPNWTPGT
ncbi:MAG: TIGR03086 family metal-binding protein [Actinomycetales bacterium]